GDGIAEAAVTGTAHYQGHAKVVFTHGAFLPVVSGSAAVPAISSCGLQDIGGHGKTSSIIEVNSFLTSCTPAGASRMTRKKAGTTAPCSDHETFKTELSVGEVAKRSGLAVSAIHFYEDQGL